MEQQREFERNERYLQKVYASLNKLRPFSWRTNSLNDDVKHFAAFVASLVPVRRVCLIQMDVPPAWAEWTAEGTQQDGFFPALLRKLEQGIPASFSNGEPLESAALARLVQEDGLRPLWAPLLIPICSDNRLMGMAYFEKESGCWTTVEINLLDTLLLLLRSLVTSQDYIQQQELMSFVFNSTMDSMNANLYITDPQTDRILFMNKTMKRTFGLEHPEGEICWQVLQKGMRQRCSFCPVRRLLQDPGHPSCVWEERNSVTGRIYENYDSLIQWIDGSTVHLQQSRDITDSKLLSRAATIDELTDMLNRRAGKEALAAALAQARQSGKPLSVALYDINMLKAVNDTYGHSEGDRMLSAISHVVRTMLQPSDFAIRLSGDEFVLVFRGTNKAEATSRIHAMQRALSAETQRLSLPYEMSFCFGVVQPALAEIMPTPSELISQADEAMYEQKRRFHIQQMERERRLFHPVPNVSDGDFSYNTEKLYDALVQSTDDYLYVCNMKTNTFRYPPAMVREFGLPGAVLQNAAAEWGAKIHEHDKAMFLESNQEIADGRTDTHCVEYRALNQKGEWVWLRCRGHLERDENGEPSLFAGFITNLGSKNKRDPLTGLYNKLEFEDSVNHLIESAAVSRFGMMLLGLDDFKHINNLYDRVFGDEVLRMMSQRIQTLLPGNASFYRLDGDEFGILVANGGPEDLRNLFGKIHSVFQSQQSYNGQKFFCTVSAGCVSYPADASDYLELFKHADYSLEQAKHTGKNRAVFFSQDILSLNSRSLILAELLRESAENNYNDFSVQYQPQVDALTGAVIGAEVLARYQCEQYGDLPPVEFIPLLEQRGLIVPTGKWILEQAVRQCKQWEAIMPLFSVSVNLSYLQVAEPDLVPFVRRTLHRYGLAPEKLVLELTETYMVREAETVQRVFDELRGIGVRVAIDDFGTGYSSLEILKVSPADIVKIDRIFIQNIINSRFDATFIQFIVALCHDVGIKVCLEGVETPEEYQVVSPMKLDMIQGYLFGRPETAESFQRKFLPPT